MMTGFNLPYLNNATKYKAKAKLAKALGAKNFGVKVKA